MERSYFVKLTASLKHACSKANCNWTQTCVSALKGMRGQSTDVCFDASDQAVKQVAQQLPAAEIPTWTIVVGVIVFVGFICVAMLVLRCFHRRLGGILHISGVSDSFVETEAASLTRTETLVQENSSSGGEEATTAL